MPPKRAAAAATKKGEEEAEPEAGSSSNGAKEDKKFKQPALKKKAVAESAEETKKAARVDPAAILAHVSMGPLVKRDDLGAVFLPDLDEDSMRADSDSFQSMSQLSPGIPIGNLHINSSGGAGGVPGSTDSPNNAVMKVLHAAGEVASAAVEKAEQRKEPHPRDANVLDGVLGCAQFVLRKAFDGPKKPVEALNAPYSRGRTVIGTQLFSHVLSSAADLQLLERTYSAAELVLLSSPAYPLEHVFTKAMAALYATRRANERSGVQEAMSINQCLAWLAFSARCPVASLIPGGEYYPDAEDYLRLRLTLPKLPLFQTACPDFTLEEWTEHQLGRCLQMMALADVSTLLDDDRCILLFALGTLYCDDGASEELRELAHATVRNILAPPPAPPPSARRSLLAATAADGPSSSSVFLPPLPPPSLPPPASSPLPRPHSRLLEPLFNLAQLIARRPDEAAMFLEMFTGAGNAPPELLLALGTAHFYGLCQRPECLPDFFYKPDSLPETIAAYARSLAETVAAAFAIYPKIADRRFHRCLIGVLHASTPPSALRACPPAAKAALQQAVQEVIAKFNPDLPDDAMIVTELRSLKRRIERQSRDGGGKRSSREVLQLIRQREREEEEKKQQKLADRRAKAAGKRERAAAAARGAAAAAEKKKREAEEAERERARLAEEEEQKKKTKAAAAAADSMEKDDEENGGKAKRDLPDTVFDEMDTESFDL